MRRHSTRSLVARGALFAATWGLITGGEANSWWIGVPAIVAATCWRGASRRHPRRLRWSAVPRFLAFLATRSIVSSVDVARRALGVRIAIDPAVFEYRTTLSAGRAALAALVTLLPGTLVVKLDGDRLLVHALASPTAARAEIQELEGHLAGLFETERTRKARAV